MATIIEYILRDPLRGLVAALFMLFLYLWREQGKIKAEIQTMERYIDDKKVDKSDFKTYMKNHDKIHNGVMEKLDLAIKFLMGER